MYRHTLYLASPRARDALIAMTRNPRHAQLIAQYTALRDGAARRTARRAANTALARLVQRMCRTAPLDVARALTGEEPSPDPPRAWRYAPPSVARRALDLAAPRQRAILEPVFAPPYPSVARAALDAGVTRQRGHSALYSLYAIIGKMMIAEAPDAFESLANLALNETSATDR
jgi:hypothetical protein